MANPDPPPADPLEDTQPAARLGISPPSTELKSPKKLDPTIVVAIISAVVTLTTAILSSPLLVAVVSQLRAGPAPSPLPPISATATTTLAGNDLATPAIDITSAVPGENALLATPAETIEPQAPTPTVPAEPTGSIFNCLAADLWTPYPTNLNPAASEGCWQLGDWGFTAAGGELLINHSPAQDQQRGLFMPVTGDVDISFNIQIDQFRVRSFDTAFLTFGIAQREPFSVYAGGFLSYSQSQPGAADIQVLVSGSNQATQRLAPLAFGASQNVRLSVRGAVLTVFLDGQPAGEPVELTAGERALWIGYVLPRLGTLEATVRDFALRSP